jgi:hypothetical protein
LRGGGTATLDWGRVADAATDEFDETLAAVIAEPIVRPDAEFFKTKNWTRCERSWQRLLTKN